MQYCLPTVTRWTPLQARLYHVMTDALRITGAAPTTLSRRVAKDPNFYDELCVARRPRDATCHRVIEATTGFVAEYVHLNRPQGVDLNSDAQLTPVGGRS